MTSPNDNAGSIGVVGFLGGAVPVTITDSIIADNASTADAPNGAATVQGAGVTNDSNLVLDNVIVFANKAVANGESGSAEGGGIWNGSIFGGPIPSLACSMTATSSGTSSAARPRSRCKAPASTPKAPRRRSPTASWRTTSRTSVTAVSLRRQRLPKPCCCELQEGADLPCDGRKGPPN